MKYIYIEVSILGFIFSTKNMYIIIFPCHILACNVKINTFFEEEKSTLVILRP